jgi:hypothetical protein
MNEDKISEAERRRIFFRKVGLETVDWHGSCHSKHLLAKATIHLLFPEPKLRSRVASAAAISR